MLGGLSRAVVRGLDALSDPEVNERIDRISVRVNELGMDRYGMSPLHFKRAMAVGAWLYRNYFRVQTHGIHHVPAGRGLLIGNHSSQLAYDGMMVATAMVLDAEPPRLLRSMIEKFFQVQPFVGTLMNRWGQLTGLPQNCELLLGDDELIQVFPEGARGGGKTVWKRYELQGFGTGFVRLAMKMRAPITPFGFIGGEEICPSLVDAKPLARMLGMPYLPITPTVLPLPLPARCSIHFGEPMYFEGTGNEEDEVVQGKVAQVKAEIARLVEEGLNQRESIFL